MSDMGSKATVFRLLWLPINSQSIKIARKYYLPQLSFSSCSGGDVNKP